MSQRLDNMKWLWCLVALHAGSVWGIARPVPVRTPSSYPATVEAQAKFFQDFFSVQLSPYKIEFGHVCEDPNTWEQRYERKDFKNHRDMGKVRWGDKKGGYGEHYWDLNHAGNADNIGDNGDDGSYHESYNSEPYDEPSDNPPTYGHDDSPPYGNDDYDPEKSNYEESGRAKRAYPKIDRGRKSERKHPKSSEQESKEESRPKKHDRDNRKQQETAETSQEEEYENDQDDESYEKPKRKRQHYRKKEDDTNSKEKNQVVLVVSHKDDAEKPKSQYVPKNQAELSQYLPQRQSELPQHVSQNQQALPQYLPQNQGHYVPKQHLEPPHFVPYEGGAGVRQQQQSEASAATTVPRLFLEPSTGHVVDRATGQAYVLQPIAPHNNYN